MSYSLFGAGGKIETPQAWRGEQRSAVRDLRSMQGFTVYIDDDRSGLPIRRWIELPDATAARLWAQDLLSQSDHYRAIEVFRAAERLFKLKSLANPGRTDTGGRSRA